MKSCFKSADVILVVEAKKMNPGWKSTAVHHKCPAIESNCNNSGKKGHYARACRQRQNIKPNNEKTYRRGSEGTK